MKIQSGNRIIKAENKRQVYRIFKWLKLEGDFPGFLIRDGKRIGYRIGSNEVWGLTFVFTGVDPLGPDYGATK